MRNHSLNVLGLEVSFKAEADPKRVERARAFLEDRYRKLTQHSGHLSKEKVLTFLALALADDVLLLQEEQTRMQEKLTELLANLETQGSSLP